MLLTKAKSERAIDSELNKLAQEMDEFEENFRNVVCSFCNNHEKVHTNVLTYPSGKSYCDEMRNAKQRKFKKRVNGLLLNISILQAKRS